MKIQKASRLLNTPIFGCIAILLFSLIFGACVSRRYLYLPASMVSEHVEGVTKGKAFYNIPPKTPTGTLRLASEGIIKLKNIDTAIVFPALNIKMIFSNEKNETAWIINPHEQLVIFPNTRGKAPIFFHSTYPSGTQLTVSKGEMKVLDLYYTLPDDEQSAQEIPNFDFRWQVNVDKTTVQETTAFDRISIPEYMYSNPYNYNYYYSPWYSPYYYPGFAPYPYYGMGFGWGPPLSTMPPIGSPPSVPGPSVPVIIGNH